MTRNNNICPVTGENTWECRCRGCRTWRKGGRPAPQSARVPVPASAPACVEPAAPVEPGTLDEAESALRRVFIGGKPDDELISDYLSRPWVAAASALILDTLGQWLDVARAEIDAFERMSVRAREHRTPRRRHDAARRLLSAGLRIIEGLQPNA